MEYNTMQESIEYKGHTINIELDQNAENPRTEWDHFTEIHCCSSKYNLGEHNHASWDECKKAIAKCKKRGDMVFDVYAYVHGGVVLSLGDFYGKLPQGHAEFDSGQSGFIVVKKKEIIESWGKNNWTEELRKKAYEVAESDIKTFNIYLSGEIYGYTIDDDCGDSCWGYYEVDDAIEEAKGSIDYIVEQTKEEMEA